MTDIPVLMTRQQAADYLGLQNTSYFQGLVQLGIVRSIKVGGRPVYTIEELERIKALGDAA